MAFRRLVHACLIAAAIGLATPAWAEVSCYPRDKVVRVLQNKYGKRWIAHGMTVDGTWRYEFWSTPDGRKWTLFVSRARGTARLACFLAGGKDWKAVGPAWKPKP